MKAEVKSNMRIIGIVKIAVILLVDFSLIYYTLGIEAAIAIIACMMLYAWLGEYIALLKDGAIGVNNLNDYEKTKLIRAHTCLTEDVKRVAGTDISKLKLHIIPSEDINAFCYGFNNVAITRSALNACDDMTLCSVLGHEISHLLSLDAVVNRLIFANVTCAILGLAISSFISISFLWIIFIVLCVCGICGGVLSMYVFHGVRKLVKGLFSVFQYLILFIYQVAMGIASRACEFRSDRFSCELGYGAQLSYFLTRFIEGQETRQKSLNEILYASHPATYKRVLRIEQHSRDN